MRASECCHALGPASVGGEQCGWNAKSTHCIVCWGGLTVASEVNERERGKTLRTLLFGRMILKMCVSELCRVDVYSLCTCGLGCVSMSRSEEDMAILLDHSHIIPFRQGLSLDLELGWLLVSPSSSPVSAPLSAEVTGVFTRFSCVPMT